MIKRISFTLFVLCCAATVLSSVALLPNPIYAQVFPVTVDDDAATIQPARPAAPLFWNSEIIIQGSEGQPNTAFGNVVQIETNAFANAAWQALTPVAANPGFTIYFYARYQGSTASLLRFNENTTGLNPGPWQKFVDETPAYPFGPAGTYRLKVIAASGGFDNSYRPTSGGFDFDNPQGLPGYINSWYRDITATAGNTARLRPGQGGGPPAGWSDIIVPTSTFTTAGADPVENTVYVNELMYLNFAWENIGDEDALPNTYNAVLTAGRGQVILANILPNDYTSAAGEVLETTNWAIIPTESGTFDLTLGVQGVPGDPQFYTYTREFTVSSEINLRPFAPTPTGADWPEPIVVTETSGIDAYTDTFTPEAGQQVFIQYAWENTSDVENAGSHTTTLYVDGTPVDTTTTDLAANSFVRAYTDFVFATAGTHTLSVAVDSGNTVPEWNEADNEFSTTIEIGTAAISTKSYTLINGLNLMGFVRSGTGLSTAADLGADIGQNTQTVVNWNAQGQGFVSHVVGFPPNNFDLVVGDAYFISMANLAQPLTYSLTGGEVQRTYSLVTGLNLITLPKSKSNLTKAADLGADIPNAITVIRWDLVGQGFVTHVVGFPPNNFDIFAEQGYFVNVTSGSLWP